MTTRALTLLAAAMGLLAASPAMASCPVIRSSGWSAWVNGMPSNAPPQLIVVGEITLPSSGYKVTLTRGPANGKTQTVLLDAHIPSGMVGAQVITKQPVRFEMTVPPVKFGSPSPISTVRVVCSGKVLKTISPVTMAW